MDYWNLLLLAIASYLAGSIPFGYLIGKAKGIDIRTVGSCNIGATNVTRTVGPWYGKLCFLLDFLKGAIPVWAAGHFFEQQSVFMLTAAVCAVLGHMFTIFLKLKGGKGISTAAGALLVIEPASVLTALAVWVAVFLIGRYVSLASICAAVAMPLAAVGFKLGGLRPVSWPIIAVFSTAALFAIIKHRSNIRRLLDGTESHFDRKKKQKDSAQ